MGLVNVKDMMAQAQKGHYAVGAFNINNLEWTKAILETAQELKSPVIVEVSEGANKYMTGYNTVAAMVKAMIKDMGITVPVALHLDHGTYEGAKACIEAGYTSVMFDGSHFLLRRTSRRQKSSSLSAKRKESLLRQRLVESAARKTALFLQASVQILQSASRSMILV